MSLTASSLDAFTAEIMMAGASRKWSTPGESHGRHLIGAFVAEMDYGTAPAVTETIHACADATRFGYLNPAWLEDMAEATAEFQFDRFGWSVPPHRVRPIPDVLTGFAAVIERFTSPGSPIVLPTPAYMPFLRIPEMVGRRRIDVPAVRSDGEGTARWALDLDGLDRALAAEPAMVVLTHPHNPLGRSLTVAEMSALTEVVDRHGARVFADEIHAPLTFAPHRHVPYASTSDTAARHTVTATSASKAWNLPGLKCGQLLFSSESDLEHWRRSAFLPEHGAATVGVLANTAAYRHGRDWLDLVVEYLAGNRALLAGADLPGLEATIPEATYLAWLDATELSAALDPEERPADFFQREAGVVLTDGVNCGPGGENGIRLNIALSRPVLVEALNRTREAVATHG